MERKGQVNEYRCGDTWFHTVNLADGTTPFILFHEEKEYMSNFYRNTRQLVTVKYVFYRPTLEEFESSDVSVQDHVLNGGLLHGPIGHSTLQGDTVEHSWTYQQFQEFCLKTYHRQHEGHI